MAQTIPSRPEISAAIRACRGALLGVAVISGVINVLYLTGSVFMLEVYDRVLPSRSLPTLLGLALLAAFLYAFQGLLDFIRSRILIRIGAAVDERLSGAVFRAMVRLPLIGGDKAQAIQPLRELDQLRSFMSGIGPAALFDLPWIPVYLAICFLFHPIIGWTAAIGAAILVVLTIFTELASRQPAQSAAKFGTQRHVLAEAGRRNSEVLGAMGMAGRIAASWNEANRDYIASQRRAADIVGGIGAASKVLRMLLQSAVLGVGAWLVIQGQATGGIMIASSILTSRALAPVELAIANWKGFVSARQSWKRLVEMFALVPPERPRTALARPSATLAVEGVSAVPPGSNRLVLHDAAFTLKAGQGLGIIGPSASGKSTLARVLVGVWQPARGKVRLDNAALDQWPPEALGAQIGYLPQAVELFAGTVAQNISRFERSPPAGSVIAAGQAAGVHDMVLRLPDGYETDIGEGGAALSAGQRQRVALARALFADPFLVVLDEPNSNLDAEGEAALTTAILSVRARGGIVVVIAHRPSALAGLDFVLAMADGRIQSFGPKDEVLRKVTRRVASANPPLPMVREALGARDAPSP